MSDESRLPTREEIEKLPRWARVAFAARCARRVLPLFRHFWPASSEYDNNTLRWAVEVAEGLAAKGAGSDEDAILAGNAADIIDKESVKYGDACYVAATASFAVDEAFRALECIDNPDVGYAGSSALQAASSIADISDVIWSDYLAVLLRQREENWTDDTPVPQSVFGSLWPTGLPLGWPVEEALVLELATAPDSDPNRIGDAVVKLWEVANEYHMAKGGGVLTLDEFRQLMPALVPVGPSAGS